MNSVLLAAGLMCSICGYASLDVREYGFSSITCNDFEDAWIGQQQLSVQVSNQGSMTDGGQTLNLVGFKFINEGQDACVVTQIYFEGGFLQKFVEIHDASDGVDFDDVEDGFVSPGNLPGGKSIVPMFIADRVLSVESGNPSPHAGIGPGEYLEIIYALQPAAAFGDVLNGLDQADMRIGIHVQAFDSGGSESFVNNIPEPATLMLLGLGSIALCKRRA